MANGVASSTYSFSSQPKAVSATRKKYRDPGEELDPTVYRDLKETSITWDRRVHRGNTYSMYTQNAIKEALAEVMQEPTSKVTRKRRPKEKSLFGLPLPDPDRIPVDLSANLVAKEEVIRVDTVEAQTDEFLPEPPPEQYQPQKTGVDVSTQVEEGDYLFNFDVEAEPILDVLINKTLEQSVMEVEEEFELATMADFKVEWRKRQEEMMKDWQAQVKEEWVLWRKKEELMEVQREQKRKEAQVLLKIQAMAAAEKHLSRLMPNAIGDLAEIAFPDMKGMAVDRLFLPQLLGQVQSEVARNVQSQKQFEVAVGVCVKDRGVAQKSALQAMKDRRAELERQRYHETQIRQGKIRIAATTADGAQVIVGPVRMSPQDSIEEVQERVCDFISRNNPELSAPWGIELCINIEPITAMGDIFASKPGDVSLVPKPEPPPAEVDLEGENGEPIDGVGDEENQES